MGLMARGFEAAIKRGQAKSKEELDILSNQLKSFENNVVDAINELITYQKKVCDKLGIEMKIEKE